MLIVRILYTIKRFDHIESILFYKFITLKSTCAAYIQNNFDQINGSTILMPYGSAPANDIDGFDADGNYISNLNPKI